MAKTIMENADKNTADVNEVLIEAIKSAIELIEENADNAHGASVKLRAALHVAGVSIPSATGDKPERGYLDRLSEIQAEITKRRNAAEQDSED